MKRAQDAQRENWASLYPFSFFVNLKWIIHFPTRLESLFATAITTEDKNALIAILVIRMLLRYKVKGSTTVWI